MDVSATFDPESLFRQQQHQQHQQQRYQMVSNKDLSHPHALHPNITHHSSNSSNNNNNKFSPFFQETTVATSAPLDNRNNIINTSVTLQPNHLHPQQQQQGHEQGYRHHPQAATADSLASLNGGGPGGRGGEDVLFDNGNNDNDAEFEVRVIANRTNVGKDNGSNNDEIHYNRRQKQHEKFNDDNRATPCHATTTATTSNAAQPEESQQPQQQGVSGVAGVKPKRLLSLDILRGITIIFMILVNTQGAEPFEQLAHSPWFGYTLADWVFPNFIFMVGMAIAIVLSPTKLVALSRSGQERQQQQQQQRGVISSSFSPSIWRRHVARIRMSLKTVKRSLILFAIGLALNGLEMIGTPSGGWIRIPGVLQRIGFCYLVLTLTVLWSPVQTLATPSGSTMMAIGTSNNEALNKMDSAHTQTIAHAKARRRSSGTTTTPMTVPKTLESSRRIRIGLPFICTTLWFILTYSIQSSATEPIPSCLYPPQAISTSTSSSTNNNNNNDTDIVVLPGFAPSRGQLSPSWCTAQSVVDTWLFTRDRDSNNPIFDAEGSLGTLMAIVTGWFGWMMGSRVVEQQRKWKVVVKRVVDQFEEEVKVKVGEEEEEEEEREREGDRGRRRREVVDESPKDISESSSFASEQQQQLSCSTPSATFLPQTMEPIRLPAPPSPSPSPFPSTTDKLQICITTHQRTFLLAHLGEWFMAGICIMFSGTILGWFLPICKGLWSPSFTLYSAGISINVLCILMYLYDLPSSSSSSSPPTSSSTLTTTTSTPSLPTKQQPTHQPPRIINNFLHSSLNILTTLLQKLAHLFTKLLICYGRNPTLIYILSELVKIILEKIPVLGLDHRHEWVQTVWSYLFFNSFYEVMPPAWASLVFSSVYILVFAPLLWGLDRKGVYLRV